MKQIKISYVGIEPKDIVDVWRLFEKGMKETKPEYPSIDEEAPEHIRAHLYQMLASPRFAGVMAKRGRKPLAIVGGLVAARPFGSPRTYCQIAMLYVDPEFRKQGIAKAMFKELFASLKKVGVHAFELTCDLKDAELVHKVLKDKAKVVSYRFGGKIVLE